MREIPSGRPLLQASFSLGTLSPRLTDPGSKIKVSPRPKRNYFGSLSSSLYLSLWANCKAPPGSSRSLKAPKCDSLFARLRFDVESEEDPRVSLRSNAIVRSTDIRERKMSFPFCLRLSRICDDDFSSSRSDQRRKIPLKSSESKIVSQVMSFRNGKSIL